MVGIFVLLVNELGLLSGCVVDPWGVVDVYVLVVVVVLDPFVGEDLQVVAVGRDFAAHLHF